MQHGASGASSDQCHEGSLPLRRTRRNAPDLTRGARGTAQLAAFAGLAALWACHTALNPPLPTANGVWVDTLPPIPPSSIDAPVKYDLTEGLAWLERTIPRHVGDLEQKKEIPGKKRTKYAYELDRGPFTLTIKGFTGTLSSVIQYKGRGWYNPPVLPEMSTSCGTGDAPPPRAQVVVQTTVSITDAWKLQPKTRATTVAPLTADSRDRCKIVLGIDVTDKVMAAAKEAMDRELKALDKEIADFKLREMAEHVWHDALQQPQRIEDSLWVLLNPTGIRLGPFELHNKVLRTVVGLSAQPQVVSGPRPPASTVSLPALDDTARTAGLSAIIQGRMTYPDASRILTRELVGDTIAVGDRTLIVRELRVLGVGDGRAAIGLRIDGAAHGMLYFVGTPVFDAKQVELLMPDLAFDVGTADLLTAGLAWLKHEDIETFLRTKVRIAVGDLIGQGRLELQQALTRELAPGIALTTTIEFGRVLSVRAAPEGFRVRALATGTSVLDVNLKPPPAVALKPSTK